MSTQAKWANLGEYIGAQVRQAINQALHDNKALLEAIAKEGAANVNVGLGGHVGSLVTILKDALTVAVLADPLLTAALAPMEAAEAAAGELGLGFGIGSFLAQLVYGTVQPITLPITHKVNDLTQFEIFDPATAAALNAAGILPLGKAYSEARGGGFDDPHTDALIEAARTYPDAATGLELLRRGLIQSPDLEKMMTRHGIPAAYHDAIASLARNLLSPADLALGNLRGTITDSHMYAYADQLGVDRSDMDQLVLNTGEPPGTQEMLTAYRRGFIDKPTLEHGIRQSRVRNEWIPTIEKLRFSPMSISDAVNAVVQNHLDHDVAKGKATDNGLDPDDFDTLVQNHGRPLSRTEMGTLYLRGVVTLDDFKQALRESDVKNKYIDTATHLNRRLIPERQITTALAHGAITRDAALAYLQIQGYDARDAAVLVETGLHEHKATLKELSRTDIQALYTDKLVTHDEAAAKLEMLGYDPNTSREILALADAKHQASLARALITQVKALYAKGELTHPEAVHRLIEGGVITENAHALLDEWDILHSVPSRILTEAQVIKAANNGVIPVAEAGWRLVGMGYTRADAIILLQDVGLVNPPPSSGVPWRPLNPSEVFTDEQGHQGGGGGHGLIGGGTMGGDGQAGGPHPGLT